jgi:hypothetical protein
MIGFAQRSIAERGLANVLARPTGDLAEHLSRPETFTLQPLLFQAWGRKPG